MPPTSGNTQSTGERGQVPKEQLTPKVPPLASSDETGEPCELRYGTVLSTGTVGFNPSLSSVTDQQDKLGEELYQAIARDLNLDIEQFNRDRQSDGALLAIEQDIQLAQTLGIQGTPFFVMNEETFSGAIPLSQLEEIFQRQKSR